MTNPFRAGYIEGQRSLHVAIVPTCFEAFSEPAMRWIAGYMLGRTSPRPQLEPQVAKALNYRQESTK